MNGCICNVGMNSLPLIRGGKAVTPSWELQNADIQLSPDNFRLCMQQPEDATEFIAKKSKELGITTVSYAKTMESENPEALEKARCTVINAITKLREYLPIKPEYILLDENMPNKKGLQMAGNFEPAFPHRIRINPTLQAPKLYSRTIHELIHQHDRANPIVDLVRSIYGKIKISKNKGLISSEIDRYATTSRSEFVARTAEKIITEGKTLLDLHPKVAELFKLLAGSKFKTLIEHVR